MLFKDRTYSYRALGKASFFLGRRWLLVTLGLCALALWFISYLWGLDIKVQAGYLWELLVLLLGLIGVALVFSLLIVIYKRYPRATKVHSLFDEHPESKR